METKWLRCRYFAFWDVPRAWVLPWQGKNFLLDSPFEEERGDYKPDYFVWELSGTWNSADEFSWDELMQHKIKRLPDISIGAFLFDTEREKADGRSFVRVKIVTSLPFG